MSYPSMGNHGDYYDANQSQQNINGAYSNNRQSNSNSTYAQQASYTTEIGQPSYGGSGYNWSNQSQPPQQNYPSGSHSRPAYSNGAWGDVTAQTTTRDQRSQGSSYATSTGTGASTHNYYNPSSSTSQSTQGLSSLAYASGLDDNGSQRHGRQTHRQNAPSATEYASAAGSRSLNRVQSPVTTHETSRYNSSVSNANYPYQNNASASPGQSNALSEAAVALAGAVSARFSQASAAMDHHSSTSPILNHSTAQRSASPYQQAQVSQSQAQKRQASSTPQTNYRPNSMSTYQVKPPSDHLQQPRQSATQRTSYTASQPQAPPVNSISNLVTPTVEEPTQRQYSASTDVHSMPSYIDPTQVFNPYAKEHERRRKEAAAHAEAEARRKKAEEEAARIRAEADAEAEARRKAEEAPAASAAKKAKKPAQKDPRTAKDTSSAPNQSATATSPPQDQAPTVASTTGVVSGETDMAAELKMMMEKMKEFRNRDPSLFQKLWDDMRKPTAQSSNTAASYSPSPQMSVQQNLPQQAQSPAVTQTQPPPVAQLTTPQAPQSIPRVGSSSRNRPRKSEVPLELPPGARLNGCKVVVENNEEDLPDLGRFPAERRIRRGYGPKASTETTQTTESPAQPSPLDPTLLGASPQVSADPPPVYPSAGSSTAPTVAPPATLTQALPPRGPAGGTIWPEEKRTALAHAAILSLKKIPENGDIEITAEDVHNMLEQNPSYIDLCELLEKKGLKFHRGHFARSLLSNVPYLNGTQNKPPATPTSPPAQTMTSQPAAISQSTTNGPMTGPVATVPQPVGAPPFVQGQLVNGAMNGSVVKPERIQFAPQYPPGMGVQMPRPKPSRPHPLARTDPPPGSKEAMARKRDFSELVDLTALSDNEDYVMSGKQARIASPSPEPNDLFQQFQNESSQPPASGQSPFPSTQNGTPGAPGVPLRFDPSRPLNPQGYTPLPHYSGFAQHPAPLPQPVAVVHKTLAKPVNKQEALRKTYYDAKTVARDILIAAGRHPSERPLNAHLAGLLGKHIDMESDLSTFNWDAIDPGGPPVPQVPYTDVPMDPPRFTFGQPGIRRSKLPEPSTESHAARLPNPDKREMPALVPAPPSEPTSSTRRPEQPVRLEKAQVPRSPVQVGTDIGSSLVVERHRGRPRKIESSVQPTTTSVVPQKQKPGSIELHQPSPPIDRRRSIRSSSTQVSSPVPTLDDAKKKMDGPRFHPSGKRIGRPPGSKNLHPSYAAMKKAAAEMTQVEVNVTSQAASPVNPVFRCRWKGCQAHLHNLDTIRNHISKVHLPTTEQHSQQNGYVCWWKKCKLLVEDEDGKLGPAEIFKDKEDWRAHIKEAHLKEVAQRLGHGPSSKHIGKLESLAAPSFPFDVSQFSFDPATASLPTPPPSSPVTVARTFSYTDPQTILQDRTRYLSDSQGRVTTPDVSATSIHEDLPPDTLRLLPADHHNYEEQAQRAFMKTHRQEKASQKAVAEETLKAISARKAKIGPGLDRGGCILVTEERRATLVQNPGIQRVVDGDY